MSSLGTGTTMFASSIANFGAGVSSAIVVKLASSIDDVLWLSAFLTPRLKPKERLCNVLTYTSVCLMQTCLAFLLSTFGSSVIDEVLGGADDKRMSTDRLLTLISGSALLLYSIYLRIESCFENVPEESQDYVSVAPNASFGSTGEDADSMDREVVNHSAMMEVMEIEEQEKVDDETVRNSKQSRSLAIVAFLGSMDDLTLFVPLLVGKAFTILQLVLGSMMATLLIIVLCIFLTRCQIVANILEKIPLFAIVAAFSVILLVKGIIFMG
jgi:hypothetical protein